MLAQIEKNLLIPEYSLSFLNNPPHNSIPLRTTYLSGIEKYNYCNLSDQINKSNPNNKAYISLENRIVTRNGDYNTKRIDSNLSPYLRDTSKGINGIEYVDERGHDFIINGKKYEEKKTTTCMELSKRVHDGGKGWNGNKNSKHKELDYVLVLLDLDINWFIVGLWLATIHIEEGFTASTNEFTSNSKFQLTFDKIKDPMYNFNQICGSSDLMKSKTCKKFVKYNKYPGIIPEKINLNFKNIL